MSPAGRLGTLDAFRGLAVVLMVLVHSFHAWLSPEAKAGQVWYLIRTAGGYPGAGFLFVSGLLLGVSAEGRHARGQRPREVLLECLRRGLEVFVYAILFRISMFASSGFRDFDSLARVDVLNCIGLSLMASAVALGLRTRRGRLAGTAALAIGLAALAPVTWGAQWPAAIPRPVAGYFNGLVHQSIFPLLPWGAFTAAGAALGALVAPRLAAGQANSTLLALAPAGFVLMALSEAANRWLPSPYAYQDYWHTAPTFTAWKLGVVLVALGLFAAWDRLPGPSALRQLGQTSLLVYWVHIEIVYGSHLVPGMRNALDVPRAAGAFVVLLGVMFVASVLRTRFSRRKAAPAPAAS